MKRLGNAVGEAGIRSCVPPSPVRVRRSTSAAGVWQVLAAKVRAEAARAAAGDAGGLPGGQTATSVASAGGSGAGGFGFSFARRGVVVRNQKLEFTAPSVILPACLLLSQSTSDISHLSSSAYLQSPSSDPFHPLAVPGRKRSMALRRLLVHQHQQHQRRRPRRAIAAPRGLRAAVGEPRKGTGRWASAQAHGHGRGRRTGGP